MYGATVANPTRDENSMLPSMSMPLLIEVVRIEVHSYFAKVLAGFALRLLEEERE